jgi:hypothetical protein
MRDKEIKAKVNYASGRKEKDPHCNLCEYSYIYSGGQYYCTKMDEIKNVRVAWNGHCDLFQGG